MRRLPQLRTFTTAATLAAICSVCVVTSNAQVPAAQDLTKQLDAAYSNRDFPTVIRIADQILKVTPAQHEAIYLRASALVELGTQRADTAMVRRGISDAREAIRHSSGTLTNYNLPYLYGMTSLASLESTASHAETSAQVAGQLLSRARTDEEKATLLYQRARAYRALGRSDAAIADLQDALRAMPKFPAAWAELAGAFDAAGDEDAIELTWNRAVAAMPAEPLILNHRGTFEQKKGMLDSAIADFIRALRLNPDFHEARLNLAYVYLEQRRTSEAVEVLGQLLRINPENIAALRLRASTFVLQRRLSDAMQDFQAVAALETSAQSAADIAFIHLFQGKSLEAFDSFNRALSIDPQARHLLAWRAVAREQVNRERNSAVSEIEKNANPVSTVSDSRSTANDNEFSLSLLALVNGDKTLDELLEEAETAKTPELKKARECEAYWFAAQASQFSGDQKTANVLLAKVLETNQWKLAAWRAAFLKSQTRFAPENRRRQPALRTGS